MTATTGIPWGESIDAWRRCTYQPCEWHVRGSLACRDHGGRTVAPSVEFRTDVYGRAEYRPSAVGPIVPAGRPETP